MFLHTKNLTVVLLAIKVESLAFEIVPSLARGRHF